MKYLRRMAALATAGLLTVSLSGMAVQATGKTTQQQIQQEKEELQNLENQLNEEQENLAGLKGEQNTLQGELDGLNVRLKEVSGRLADLEQQIDDKEKEIAETQAGLEKARELEQWQQESMVLRVQKMYECKTTDYLQALFSMDGLREILNEADFYESIVEYDRKKFAEFQENRKLIEEQEARLQIEKTELDSLKKEAEAEAEKVSELIEKTSDAITKYAGQISDAEKRALEYEEEIKKSEENLEYLNKKLQEEIAMSQAAANSTWRDISEVTFTESDKYLLANLIYCEAGGEPYAGQLAVGSVVINRVLSSLYPDTVVGVIYQSRQFSPVASGRLDLALATDKATESCYRAAEEAMNGVTNVGNCVYFRTPVEGLTGISIGGHIFY